MAEREPLPKSGGLTEEKMLPEGERDRRKMLPESEK